MLKFTKAKITLMPQINAPKINEMVKLGVFQIGLAAFTAKTIDSVLKAIIPIINATIPARKLDFSSPFSIKISSIIKSGVSMR